MLLPVKRVGIPRVRTGGLRWLTEAITNIEFYQLISLKSGTKQSKIMTTIKNIGWESLTLCDY